MSWHHRTKSTGHPIQQSTTYCTYLGGEVMVLHGDTAIITNSATSATTYYATINPPITQQYAIQWEHK
eukprot:scaffold33883_cov36-Cyclotella_meneghiniana.AAC.1